MKTANNTQNKMIYLKPMLRELYCYFDKAFLQSNTEPIDDDGQEHGWD